MPDVDLEDANKSPSRKLKSCTKSWKCKKLGNRHEQRGNCHNFPVPNLRPNYKKMNASSSAEAQNLKAILLLALCGIVTCTRSISGFLKRDPRPPLGDTERFPGGHDQRPSLGSFAVILHNPSVTIY